MAFDPPGRVVVPAPTERTSQAAELLSIEADLEFVIAACAALAPLQATAGYERQASDPATVTARALWTAALTVYARCFGARRTMLTEEDVASLGLAPKHDAFMAQRDQHVVHSVRPLELIRIGAVLSEPPIERGVMGIWNSQAGQANGDDEDIAALARLATLLLQFVGKKKNDALQAVQAEFLARPLDDLYAMKTDVVRPLNASDLKRERRGRKR